MPAVLETPDECDCPVCADVDFDLGRLIGELTATAADLFESEDPLDAEIAGATFVSMGATAGEAFDEALTDGFIPAFEAHATAGALAMLLSIGAVVQGQAGKAASAAAGRLLEKGVPLPGWAAELDEPVTVADCGRLHDTQGTASMLACSFHRGERSHAVVMSVDDLDCGAATGIVLLDADQLPEALECIQADGRGGGFEIVKEALDAADFRWHVQNALDARAVHDSGPPGLDDLELDEDSLPVEQDDGPGYPALAVLLRARMTALPAPDKPPAPHAREDDRDAALAALQMLAQLAGRAPFEAPSALTGQAAALALPAKRTKADWPAPVYQIKVGLQGSKPPIWRRLQVAADISLAQLHQVIQVAFDWDDCHMHVFTTPYGDFGVADADLGHRAEAPVTLEQVAPAARSKIRYTYDFGDGWTHDILVEKVLDRAEAVNYPRCKGGRRAAPPEDCGGVWGYAELTEVLSDPGHPEHEDRLQWLGLDRAGDFDPAAFDAEAVGRALSLLR